MYLTIITTVLVITQIIRLVQNAISLSHIKETDKMNVKLMEDWKVIINNLHDVLEVMENGRTS